MSKGSPDRPPAVFNPITGVRVRLPETVDREVLSAIGGIPTDGEDPEAAEIELPAGAQGPPEHVHPTTEERFAVIEGTVTFRVNGSERRLERGASVRVSPGTEHTFGNDGDRPARLYARTVPESEALGEVVVTLFGLAVEGRTDDRGRPGLLQGAAIAESVDETHLAGVPVAAQRLFGRTLGPVARAMGYRATYDRFLDRSFWETASEQDGVDRAANDAKPADADD